MFTNIAVIVFESLLLFLIVINVFRMKKKNKEATELLSRQKDRIREEELDSMLQNKAYIGNSENARLSNDPYESAYHEEAAAQYIDDRPHMSVNIDVSGILSNKRYMVHVFDSITIGRGDNNKVILNDVNVAVNQLQLIRHNSKLLVRNLSESVKVELVRGSDSTQIGDVAIYVESGDRIVIGKTTLTLTLI